MHIQNTKCGVSLVRITIVCSLGARAKHLPKTAFVYVFIYKQIKHNSGKSAVYQIVEDPKAFLCNDTDLNKIFKCFFCKNIKTDF